MTGQEYAFLCRQIREITGIDLSAYKSQQMQRRLDAYLKRSGARGWAEYLRRLTQDPKELRAFRDYLTINVSSFFRDPEKFRRLGDELLPQLMHFGSELTMWSAGCSYGAEAYSLAMVAEMREIRRYHVWGTDIDLSALERAQAGGPYTAEDVKNVPSDLRKKYLELRAEGWYVRPSLRQRVTFSEHNLLEDEIGQSFDLVVCRNVIIYFSDAAKQRALSHLVRALRPGGILFVGGTEMIPFPLARQLGLQAVGISFYRKEEQLGRGVL
ncbi:MAG: protein-glutamate O-methyltransferase CheR [Anaerolineae bacterium]|nr:protein-glutamate O-methyltransferase CheR [Anaerolineae bacterium]MDW8099703.1 protein-glutamate O-methyltransferase CheR [Anaerolineae bacterium]